MPQPPRDVCILANPLSGGGRFMGSLRDAVGSRPGFDLRLCPDPAVLADMAMAAVSEGFGKVAVAGGDGSIGAVASGIARSPGRAQLGLVPMGTGNDFARGLGIPVDLGRALDALRSDGSRSLDLIRCRTPQMPGVERYAINAVAGGLGGRIGDRMTPELSRRWGRLAYVRAGLGELATARPTRLVLSIDGSRFETSCIMLVIANGRFAGGAIDFAPAADPGDGTLDAVAITAMPRLSLMRAALRILRGRVTGTGGVITRSGRSIEVEAGPSFWFNLDGETWAAGAARFDVVPGAVDVIVP